MVQQNKSMISNDIDLVLSNQNKKDEYNMKNAKYYDERGNKIQTTSSSGRTAVINGYDDLFIEKDRRLEGYKNEDDGASSFEQQQQQQQSQNKVDKDDDDVDEIPTLDNFHLSNDHISSQIYDINLRIAQLPTLNELDAKIDHTSKRRNDSIDLSPLLNQLIRKDYVVQESDVNWSTDSLLNDIKTFFRQHDGQE